MTTRRDVLIMAGGAALLSGCRDRGPVPVAGTAPDPLLADTRRTLLRLTGGHRDDLGERALPAPDASQVYAAAVSPGITKVLSIDPVSGERTGRGALPGSWHPRAVSADGRSCALTGTPPDPGGGRPAARPRTALTVLRDGRGRTLDLAGIVEPDAFTTDGTGLFVLQWLPAAAPDRYRVRLLNLTSGVLQPLLTRAKTPVPPGAEEEMRGAGRQALLSPDRQVLYTLYTHQGEHRHTRDLIAGRPGGVHAFVHVLHLEQRWAYCLDLPHPFGEGPATGHTMALSGDGLSLLVADLTSGSLARADTGDLTVRGVSALPAATGPAATGPATAGPATAGPATAGSTAVPGATRAAGMWAAGMVAGPTGDTVFIGAGSAVTVVDAATGAAAARWAVPHPVRGLCLSHDGRRLYAGGTDEVVWLDTGTGDLLGRAPVPGLTALRYVC